MKYDPQVILVWHKNARMQQCVSQWFSPNWHGSLLANWNCFYLFTNTILHGICIVSILLVPNGLWLRPNFGIKNDQICHQHFMNATVLFYRIYKKWFDQNESEFTWRVSSFLNDRYLKLIYHRDYERLTTVLSHMWHMICQKTATL